MNTRDPAHSPSRMLASATDVSVDTFGGGAMPEEVSSEPRQHRPRVMDADVRVYADGRLIDEHGAVHD
jgi:hypothetical protein